MSIINEKFSKAKKKKYGKVIAICFLLCMFIYSSLSVVTYIKIDKVAEDYDIIYHNCGSGKYRVDND